MRFTIFASLALAVISVSASPIDKRQSSTKCGSTSYSSSIVTSSFREGYGYYQQGEQLGSGDYPHTYNNYEGFDFPVSGPYQEYPLTKSGTYGGGSPGADRVVFNTRGQYAGAITHTGASGNNFVGCSGTS